MRRNLLILCCVLLSVVGHAQQRYKGQWSATVLGGINVNSGYFASIQAERYSSHPSSMVIDVTWINSNYVASDNYNFTVAQYMAACRYNYSIRLARPLYMSFGIGGLVGYENPPIRTDELKILKYDSKFLIGIDFMPSLELVILPKVSLCVEQRVCYLLTTNFENLISTTGAGLKLYF